MQKTSIGTASASTGAAGAAVVVLVWVLGLFKVQLPGDVAAAIVMILSPLVHFAAMKIGIESTGDGASVASKVAPASSP